jgi:hypothetical protein
MHLYLHRPASPRVAAASYPVSCPATDGDVDRTRTPATAKVGPNLGSRSLWRGRWLGPGAVMEVFL